MDLQRLKNPEGSFTMIWYKSVLNLSYHVHITIIYDQTTHLPMMHAYKSISTFTEAIIETYRADFMQVMTQEIK